MMFAVVLIAALSCSLVNARTSRIVNGENAAEGEFPHQVSLQMEGRSCTGVVVGNNECIRGSWQYNGVFSHICGAAVIDDYVVVTAAHCIIDTADHIRLVVGLHNRANQETEGRRIRPVSIILHENYGTGTGAFPNDIAIMKTSESMADYVVEMAADGEDFSGKECSISGWGRLSGGGALPSILQKTTGIILTKAECSNSNLWGSNINDGHVCIHNIDTGSCNGDSGGPMTCTVNGVVKLAGVTSWGRSGCDTNYPSVYSGIAYFRKWIDSNMN